MNGKERRREYRRAIKARGAPDRLTDLVRAIVAGGTSACACCTLVRTRAELDEAGICGTCRGTLVRVRATPPVEVPPIAEPHGRVWVDASFRSGYAGIAVAGALGEHVQRIEALTSTQAETMALEWAMEIAREHNRTGLRFYTDCQKAVLLLRGPGERMGCAVVQIPRAQNQRADLLASRARTKPWCAGRIPVASEPRCP